MPCKYWGGHQLVTLHVFHYYTTIFDGGLVSYMDFFIVTLLIILVITMMGNLDIVIVRRRVSNRV